MAIKRKTKKAVAASNDRTLAIIMHILGIFISFVSPLIFYLATDDAFTKENSRNALNWHISAIIYGIISVILIIVIIGIVFLALLAIANVVFCIVAAVKASDGEAWAYPFSIKFLK